MDQRSTDKLHFNSGHNFTILIFKGQSQNVQT